MFPDDFFLPQIYDFRMVFTVTETKKGGPVMTTYATDIEKWAIFGGSKRTIRKNGSKGIGDADVMSEFYQAKHFHNLVLTKPMNGESAVFQRIFDQKLSFQFSFTVKSLETASRFRFLQLVTKKARLTKPPLSDVDGDTLNIKYSDPEVFYSYEQEASEVTEKI